MARMPGAVWQPKSVSGRAARRKGRGVCFHVAVSEAQSLMPGPNADWHFYVAKNGAIYQYIDTDLQAWANGAGNATMISVETQGGVIDPQGERWTAAQVSSLARIARWAHEVEGVPLRLMASSRPEEQGLGWHRLGCDPWRVSGGELWSSSVGKICPGDAKIAQVPEVLRQALGEDDMPTVAEFWNAKTVHPMTGQETIVIDLVKDGVRQATRAAVDAAIARKLAEAAAKGVALSQADVDRIAEAAAAEVAEDLSQGYDLTATPKTDPAA